MKNWGVFRLKVLYFLNNSIIIQFILNYTIYYSKIIELFRKKFKNYWIIIFEFFFIQKIFKNYSKILNFRFILEIFFSNFHLKILEIFFPISKNFLSNLKNVLWGKNWLILKKKNFILSKKNNFLFFD